MAGPLSWMSPYCQACARASPVSPTGLGFMQVTGKLNAVERGLLATRMAKLRATLDPALAIQNWHSLGILDFVAAVNKVPRSHLTTSLLHNAGSQHCCLPARLRSADLCRHAPWDHTLGNLLTSAVHGAAQATGEFEVLVQQVQKNASLVEHAVSAISHAKACAGPPAGAVLDLHELQEHIESHRVKERKHSSK